MDSKQVTRSAGQLNRAFVSTRTVLETVRRDQLDSPTPCASWTVGALINHLVGSARWAAASIGGHDGVPDHDDVAGDFLACYDESAKAAVAAFEAAGASDRTVKLPFGEVSGAALMGIAAMDQFTHGWDLARAIGQRTNLDPELAAELFIQAQVTVVEAWRGADGRALFGPIVEAPTGACPADRLAAFLGRTI